MLTPPHPHALPLISLKKQITYKWLQNIQCNQPITHFVSQQLQCDVHTVECDDCHERFPAEEAVEHSNICPGGTSSGFSERRWY